MDVSLVAEVPADLADLLIANDEAERASLVRGAGDQMVQVFLDGLGPTSSIVTIVTGVAVLAKRADSFVRQRRDAAASADGVNPAITVVGPGGTRTIEPGQLTPDELARVVEEVRGDRPGS